jgi:formamidopyrimidine-DNA glycosylase
MPELAEVETVRRQLDLHMKGRKIKEVIADDSDRWLFAFASVKDVKKALKNAEVVGTGRKGKYFWLELNRKPWPLFHLGMSGNIAILDPKVSKTQSEKSWGGVKLWSERNTDLRDRLWFCRLLLKAQNGFEMAFIDPRRFGRMWLTDDPWEHPRIKKLGFDPLLDFPSARELADRLKKRKKTIKAVLLDQNLFAGIGNWLADEILYQARVSPHHLASSLKPTQVKKIHEQLLLVVKKAVAVGADHSRFPATWLFHERWGKNAAAKTSRGQKIIHEEIGGRTTAWVPGWQK